MLWREKEKRSGNVVTRWITVFPKMLHKITIIWSAHQYQMDAGVWPMRKPSQGRSWSESERNMRKESFFGCAHCVMFGGTLLGTACMYFEYRFPKPPISMSPITETVPAPRIIMSAWAVSVNITAVSPPVIVQIEVTASKMTMLR